MSSLPESMSCQKQPLCPSTSGENELPHLTDDNVHLLRQFHGLNHALDDCDLISQLQAEEEPPQLNSPMSGPAKSRSTIGHAPLMHKYKLKGHQDGCTHVVMQKGQLGVRLASMCSLTLIAAR